MKEVSRVYYLEYITAKNKITGEEYHWYYEGQDLFSKAFGDREMITGEELEKQLYKALCQKSSPESIYSNKWEITGMTKDGISKKIGKANVNSKDPDFNKIEVYDSCVYFCG